MNKQDLIKNSKRVVIKIGSALLIDSKTGKLQKNWLDTLAFDIHNLINSGVEVIIVSSGSIALGKKQLYLKDNLSLDEKQAAAATGQITLAHAWKETMSKYKLNIAQILLAPDDTVHVVYTLQSPRALGFVKSTVELTAAQSFCIHLCLH